MRRALRSKRCQRCRRRKIKCDENWPTCGPCERAGSTCSGPPIGDQFPDVIKGPSSSTSSSVTAEGVASPIPLPTTGRSARERQALKRKLIDPPSPRQDPTTTAERVAARLISYLDRGSTSSDVSIAACYLRLLPSRLGSSPALRDSVALFCSCWGAFRRGVPPDRLIDPKSYGKALRSLQVALNEPANQLKDETLAAISILDRVEVMFDKRCQFGKKTHARGISSIMTKKGPPAPNNELGVLLALANHGNLLYSSQFDGASNIFLTPPWQTVLAEIVDQGLHDIPRILVIRYQVDQRIDCWPQLLIDVQNLKEPLYPVYGVNTTAAERKARAIVLRQKVEKVAAMIREEFVAYKDAAFKEGLVTEVTDLDSVIGKKYEIANVGAAQLMLFYLGSVISFNRIQYELGLIIGERIGALDSENKALSREVWMSLKFVRNLGPIGAILFSRPMMFALEAADHDEKKYILETLLELDKYKQSLPSNLDDLEEMISSTGRVYLGRATMGDLQRFSCSTPGAN